MKSKVKTVKYTRQKGQSKSNAVLSLFQVAGNTESAVIAHLQKKHPGFDITIRELQWA
jgi:hypothetical protein